jgi:predicted nuclease of predicted toxin-antitoxin system
MRLLFDQNLSRKLCVRLANLFPDSVQVKSLGLSTADDREIWRYAERHGFVVVSLDADFAELAALYGPPPKVVWLRCGNLSTAETESRIRYSADALVAFEASDAACLEIY